MNLSDLGSPYIILFLVWSLFWKGLALWHAARREERWWFLALFLINTAGILEIIYLFGIAKLKPRELFPHDRKADPLAPLASDESSSV